MKRCTGCGETKPIDDYYLTTNRYGKKYPTARCKRCHVEYTTAWRKQNPDKVREIGERHAAKKRFTRLQREYGLTPDEYVAMVDACGGRCAICDLSKPLDVDHDHDTGRVRGLLCRNCNRAIGWMHDDPAILRRAVAYLEGAA